MKKQQSTILIGSILLIIITLPYLVAYNVASDDAEFGGFLVNPLDGNTYLAKMQEGYQGEWLFTLPFTAGHTKGVFLFEFYLLLGHLARWFGFPLLTVFHLARVLSAFFFLLMLAAFLQKVTGLSGKPFAFNILLICFGSGLGWLFLLLGQVTSDLWVAEAYPFLSSFTNPHFILGMALLLAILVRLESDDKWNSAVLWLLGLLLAIIMPFAAVLAGLIAAVREVWRWVETRNVRLGAVLSILLGAGVMVLYQYWQIHQDPFLANWNAQNVTPGMPLWDLVGSFSPVLLFAILEVIFVIRNRKIHPGNRLLLIWVIVSLVLTVVPFSLQRRFIFAIYIPLAILAVQGMFSLSERFQKINTIFITVFVTSCLTNLIILFSSLTLVSGGNDLMVISNDEKTALEWVSKNAEAGDIILASPIFGNFVPGRTGSKVIYGHPFETADAATRENEINRFYRNDMTVEEQQQYIAEHQIKWIIQGTREASIGRPVILMYLPIAYQNTSITLYQAIP